MKITFVLPVVSLAGGIKVVAIYAEALARMGHEILLISPAPKKTSIKHKLKALLRGNGWPTTNKNKSHLDATDVEHKVLGEYRAIVDKDVPDADIIIATWWETAEWVMRLSDSKGAKVYFVQGHETYTHLPVERCKATYKFPMHKIVIAKWLKDIMINDYGDNDSDLVPNSVDHAQFFANLRDQQNIPTVGFLYSKSSYKGVDITLEVIKLLRKKLLNLRVICFGAHKPKESLGENIEFIHSPKQDAIRKIYSKCDVWITASRIEGFNLPAMEAMACRTPIVSTKAGWPEESINNGINGMLVEVDDTNSLFKAALDVLSYSNNKWRSMSENAYKTVENSSWDNSSKQFERSLINACIRANKNEISGSCTGLD